MSEGVSSYQEGESREGDTSGVKEGIEERKGEKETEKEKGESPEKGEKGESIPQNKGGGSIQEMEKGGDSEKIQRRGTEGVTGGSGTQGNGAVLEDDREKGRTREEKVEGTEVKGDKTENGEKNIEWEKGVEGGEGTKGKRVTEESSRRDTIEGEGGGSNQEVGSTRGVIVGEGAEEDEGGYEVRARGQQQGEQVQKICRRERDGEGDKAEKEMGRNNGRDREEEEKLGERC